MAMGGWIESSRWLRWINIATSYDSTAELFSTQIKMAVLKMSIIQIDVFIPNGGDSLLPWIQSLRPAATAPTPASAISHLRPLPPSPPRQESWQYTSFFFSAYLVIVATIHHHHHGCRRKD